MTSQAGHRLRFEWGPTGAEAVLSGATDGSGPAYAVVVDVLSFTTCVSVAIDRGIAVHPYRWQCAGAQAYADERGAVLATGRGTTDGRPDVVTLSPASVRAAVGVDRLVLPSPNGSTIASLLAGTGVTVVAAALRNRVAVARWLAEQVLERPGPVLVVAAGERWPDGSLRPAVEDLWGAGAVLDALADAGGGDPSPEAAAAAAAFRSVGDLEAALLTCSSGVELVERGFTEDVEIAAELDGSDRVPVLADEAFSATAGREQA